MRKLLLCILCFLFGFYTCKERTEKPVQTSESDAIRKNYWTVDNDTIIIEKKLSMYNEFYDLRILKYCLNDSSVINQSVDDARKFLDISHNYAADIILKKGNKIIFEKQITKNTFKESLNTEFYKKARLFDIGYEAVRVNRLYFYATLVIPHESWTSTVNFSIFYQTDKLGELSFQIVSFDKD